MATLRARLPNLPPLDSRFLVRLFVIGGMLAAVAYLAQRPTMRMLPIPLGVVGAWLLLRQPGLGPVLVLVSCMAVRFAVGTGTQTSIHLGFLLVPLLSGLWIAKMFHRRSFSLAPARAYGPLVGLAVTAVVSFVAGNLTWNAFAQTAPLRSQVGALGIFLVSVAAFFLAANEIKDVKWLRLMVWAFLIIGSVYILGRLIPSVSRLQQIMPAAAIGSMFWTWLVAMAGAQALFNRDLAPVWRLLCGGLVLATLTVATKPGEPLAWASGWLPPLLGAGVLVWLRWPRLTTFLGGLAAVVGLLNYPLVSEILLSGDNAYSLVTRSAAWNIVVAIVQVNPLLGIGPANYFFYTPLFPILGYYVNFNSHNQYIDLLAQTGIVGTACFALFLLAVGRAGWKLRRAMPDGFSHAYVNACLAGLAATVVAGMLGDWIIPFVYNIALSGTRASLLAWLFLGGLTALAAIHARAKAAATPSAAVQSY